MTLLAVACYLSTVTLGVASLRGRRVKRAWHSRLFILTLVVTLLAAAFSFAEHWIRGFMLALALVPLGLLPFLSVPVAKNPARHAIISLVAAPFYLAAAVLWAVALGGASVWVAP